MLILVLGGAASGKSQMALDLARGLALPQAVPVPVRRGQTPRADAGKGVSPRFAFVATGQALDREMKIRIERHQATRSSDWETAEVSTDLADWFSGNSKNYQVVVLDCLTLWLSNLQGQHLRDVAIFKATTDLLQSIRTTRARVVIVSNELGLGLVPATKPVRAFRDLAGRVNQQVAAEADEVYLAISGIPLRLK
ncbi:MAG: bifunctional adenosylcobinamide kinase/adenosylcobinamide-phosphate guanylyltransferase [Nitrospira sp.]|nr:bifunctional adenosylcobinamide kinase/adenosylcobinamide-phosphate guanylyltransferase [Nitrospira sp.]